MLMGNFTGPIEVTPIVGGDIEAENIATAKTNTYKLENVIAFAGTNYCVMTACDLSSDICKKVYKINDDLLIGVTGTFDNEDNPLDPFIGHDVRRMLVEEAVMCIEQYLIDMESKHSISNDRQYLVAGRSFGQYSIVSIEFSHEKRQMCRNVFSPSYGKVTTALSLSGAFDIDVHEFFNAYKETLVKCNDMSEVVKCMEYYAAKATKMSIGISPGDKYTTKIICDRT